ncbi:tRNA (adenosine(37)-N6)-dimethylallyltransferase MiaA [Roseivivax isoporae]|uniref:tRNA dimethylallyltransferase n=1 Tax=Roseivivax isoporae LMG 25204 TaxID=1449351 RepID=X7FD47_9RHOB|nr:tRNA (adenosine(37)-N6)-dimethylallyltransferase MiaA [Roseivivax isoporae]ETX30740.1 tRNA delta(2)-isopentenylpyrophosphate transferase [Roseivivax isoporae LMG 25204]
MIDLDRLSPDCPVLIAGPTASGKSGLALALAEAQGGVVVNADAIQVHGDWRVLTARPSPDDEARAPHALYGFLPGDEPYSVGRWLRDLGRILDGPDRPIIVGGTGLYFTALTEGLADIPETPPELRAHSGARLEEAGLAPMVAELDPESRARIDLANPVRVQRAWEVLQLTGRGIAAWQDDPAPPLLPLAAAQPLVIDAPKDWLGPRIARRFRAMLDEGALDEARANAPGFDPARPSSKAIGATELVAHVEGRLDRDTAIERAVIQTRQFAKRQRTWFRARMGAWRHLHPAAEGV